MEPSDIFHIEYHITTVTVSLKWNTDASVTVEETDDVGAFEAEAMAIGRLWQEYGQDIINHICDGM